jgi:Virulence factor membrane-bound polymerase, C-terminal/Protein glycosylation ligase
LPRLILSVPTKRAASAALLFVTGQILSLERACFAVALVTAVLAWIVPNHYPPWTSFYNESAMAVAIAALAVPVFLRRGGPVPVAVWVLLAVATTPWIQWFGGVLHFTGDALVASGYILGVAISVFVGHALAERESKRVAVLLSSAAVIAGLISSVLAITQAFDLASWEIWAEYATPNMRAVGNLAQPNDFATLLGLGAIGCLYLHERTRWPGIAWIAIASALIVAGALTQSRISLMFGPLIGAGVYLARKRGTHLRATATAVTVLTLLHWILMAAFPFVLVQLFGESPDSLAARGLDTPRYQMWQMLIHALNEVPWSGYGWLQIGAAELAIVDRYPPIGELWLQGHNIFVELVVCCGWPMGLLLGGTLVYWFASRTRRFRSVEAMAGMLVFSLVGLHSLVEFPYEFAYFLFPVGLWVGLVEADVHAPTIASARLMFPPSVIALVTCVLIWIEYPAVEDDFRLVRFENARIGSVRAVQTAPDAPLLSTLTSFLRFARTDPVAGMGADELDNMRRVSERYPYAASLVRYASALALNGRLEEGRRTFIKIRYIFGDRMYTLLKGELHQKVGWGEVGLEALDRSLPPASQLKP